MTAGRWLQYGALTLLLALGGCGGSSGGDSASGGMGGSGSGSGQYAEGGMGGSGSGTSSGYGSIYLNDNRRHYPIDANADVFLDGERVAPGSINATDRGLPLGMTLEFLLAGDAASDLASGTAIRIIANHRVIGPVTQVDPYLEVMGQPVQLTGETLLAEPLTPSAVNNLVPGDVVKVDGLVNGSGTIRATRLEKPAASPLQWQLIGRVDSEDIVANGQFTVNGQTVVLNGVQPECSPALTVDDQVLVRASEDTSTFGSDALVDTVLSVECLPEGLSLFAEDPPDSQVTELPATVDAIITDASVDSGTGIITLDLNGQSVIVDPSNLSELLFGTLGQLDVGARIEVDGTLNLGTGVIQADSIRFRDPLVEITGPVGGGIAGELLLTLGIEVRPTPATVGAGLFAVPDTGSQAQISGFVTDKNVVYAETLSSVGPADPADVSLSGPVTDINDSLDQLGIAGTLFDTASADSIQVQDVTGVVVDSFCNLLPLLCGGGAPDLEGAVSTGDPAALSGAAWNASSSQLETGDLILVIP